MTCMRPTPRTSTRSFGRLRPWRRLGHERGEDRLQGFDFGCALAAWEEPAHEHDRRRLVCERQRRIRRSAKPRRVNEVAITKRDRVVVAVGVAGVRNGAGAERRADRGDEVVGVHAATVTLEPIGWPRARFVADARERCGWDLNPRVPVLQGEEPSPDSPRIEKTSSDSDPSFPDETPDGAIVGHSKGRDNEDPLDRLTRSLDRATAAGKWDLAERIMEQIKRVEIARADNVVSIGSAKKGGSR